MKHLSLILVLGVATLGISPARGGADASVEDRLARLEAQLARIEARLGDTVSSKELAPTLKEFSDLSRQLGYDGKTPLNFVKTAGKEPKFSLGGFTHLQSEFGDATDTRYTGINNRIQIRRARITFKGSFKENFEFTLQPDFGNNSVSGNTGYRGGFADAFVAWTKYDAASLQLGQFKSAFGYEQLTADTKTLTVERALANDSITVSRQIGVALNGAVFNKRLAYSVGAYNGNGVNNGNNDNDQFMYAGRLTGTVWSHDADKLNVSVNGYWSNDNGTFLGRRTGRGLDAQLTLGQFDLQGEYLSLLQNRFTGADTSSEGWYGLIGYYLVPKSLQAIVRYQTYDANVRANGFLTKAWDLGANYYLKGDDIKFTFTYTIADPAGPLANQGRLMARLQVIF